MCKPKEPIGMKDESNHKPATPVEQLDAEVRSLGQTLVEIRRELPRPWTLQGLSVNRGK